MQQVANLEKKVPLEWITPDGMQVTEACLLYTSTTKRAYDELEKEGFLYAVPAKGFFVAPKNTAVSYTHLDVYKRQGQASFFLHLHAGGVVLVLLFVRQAELLAQLCISGSVPVVVDTRHHLARLHEDEAVRCV